VACGDGGPRGYAVSRARGSSGWPQLATRELESALAASMRNFGHGTAPTPLTLRRLAGRGKRSALGVGAHARSSGRFWQMKRSAARRRHHHNFAPRGAGRTSRLWVSMLFAARVGRRGTSRADELLGGCKGYFVPALDGGSPARRVRKAANWFPPLRSAGAVDFLRQHGGSACSRFAWRFLPGYGGFQESTRALMPAMFCVAVLAAEASRAS